MEPILGPILECCCGVDVHKNMIEACIIKGIKEPEYIRKRFSTFQNELIEFVNWLYENDCFHIAMESTGVYWRPVYEAIEEFSPYYENIIVANAHHMRNIPGRKTDVKDAEWIATLMQHGLLESSFVPDRNIRDLREFSRTYKNAVSEKSRCLNRLEKFLQTHGFKLSSVLSDINSVSGINILTILSQKGSLTIDDIENAVSRNTKKSPEEIQSAICGRLNANECFLLADFLNQLRLIEQHIELILNKMIEIAEPYKDILEKLDSIIGIDVTAALLILAEIGSDVQKNFQTAGHLCSWAGLKPRNDESAEKYKSKKVMHGNPYIKSILCQCAWVAAKNRNNPFGHWFWSHQSKLGKKKAIIAVSRKILSLAYYLIVTNQLYDNSVAMRPYLN